MQINLKAARVNKNLTQKEAADAFGVTVQTLRNWEQYKSSPSAVFLSKICELYEVDFDNIIFLRQ